MTHPIIPAVLEVARPIAEQLNLEVVDVVFQTNQRPPILRIDIRNPQHDTGLDDCEKLSRELEAQLEAQQILPGAYVLEVSSPGISSQLESDRDFIAFKGFEVLVSSEQPHKGKQQWQGRLQGRDDEAVLLNIQGRNVKLPRALGLTVILP